MTATRPPRPPAPADDRNPALALLYGRLSMEEQLREGLSLPAQFADCRRYAAARGWAIGGEYRDVLSGRRVDRPEYQQLLADARRLSAQGRRVVVVCKWLHRLGRRVLEAVRCREELRGLGVAVHSVMEGGEVSDFIANIMASVAEEEVRQLGERVAEVIRHTRANGWHHVGRPRWGYRWRDATPQERAEGAPKRVLDLHPEEAPYARESWRRVAAGETLRAVTAWATALPPEARGGRTLRRAEFSNQLRAPVYVGRHERGEPGTPGRGGRPRPARGPVARPHRRGHLAGGAGPPQLPTGGCPARRRAATR